MFTTGLFIGYTVGSAVTMLFMLGILRWVEQQEAKEEKFDIDKSLKKEMEQLRAIRDDKG